MTQRALFVLAVAALILAVCGRTPAEVRRERTERRPYIVEVGEPYSISMEAVDREAGKIREMSEYLSSYGYPDYAEVQEVEPEWPWESYEVRLYYMHRNIETDFGHVLFSPAMPRLGVLKFQGEIAPQKRHEIEVILAARSAPPPAPVPVAQTTVPVAAPVEPQAKVDKTEAIVARMEAAAERAARAADLAAEASEAAVRSADRTESILDKLGQEQASAAPSPHRRRSR